MKIFKYISLFVACVAMGSCGDFLEEYSQDKYYVRSWKDLDELLVGSAYLQTEYTKRMPFWGSEHYGQFLHCMTDDYELVTSAPGNEIDPDCQEVLFGYYTWQQTPGLNDTYTDYVAENPTWTKCYYHINVLNNIIGSLEKVPQNTDEEIQGYCKVKGEAHFLRAYYYFFLANLYGKPYDETTAATDLAVPIKLSENVEDIKFGRNTVKEVYDLVLGDLKVARENLSKLTAKKKSIYRADSVAANLLTSRVYLYMQDWDKAAEFAGKVIDSHPQLENLNSPSTDYFASRNNLENIFSMGGDDVPVMMEYKLKTFSASQELYSLYNTDDLRRTKWYWHMGTFSGVIKVKSKNDAGYPVTNFQHYFMNYNSYYDGRLTEVSSLFWMRSAEAYLIKAEAEAYRKNETEAKRLLEQLRKNRYSVTAGDYTEKTTGVELIKAIRNERRKELAFEGHRWFDLRRYLVNKVYKESKEIVHDYIYYTERLEATKTSWRRFVLKEYDPAYTLPIPREVLRFNTGMPNNERPWREYEELPLN